MITSYGSCTGLCRRGSTHPGVYPIRGQLTPAQAVMMARGLSTTARLARSPSYGNDQMANAHEGIGPSGLSDQGPEHRPLRYLARRPHLRPSGLIAEVDRFVDQHITGRIALGRVRLSRPNPQNLLKIAETREPISDGVRLSRPVVDPELGVNMLLLRLAAPEQFGTYAFWVNASFVAISLLNALTLTHLTVLPPGDDLDDHSLANRAGHACGDGHLLGARCKYLVDHGRPAQPRPCPWARPWRPCSRPPFCCSSIFAF